LPCYNDTCFKMATRAYAPLALKRCYVTSYQRTENRPQRRPRFIFSYALSFRVLVGLGGLEPPTSPLSGVRSNHLSYRPKNLGESGWWSQSGSNRRPPACKAGALPAELWPQASLGHRIAPLRDALNAGALCGCLTGQSVIL
jgi:hypothetical protein